jgi:3-oxoacyl-[acyl-carrier protein] reductase
MIETGLAGKVVIVTGGAAGIGRATALRFAAEGARVAVWDVSGEAAAKLTGELEAGGGEGHFATVDVTDGRAVGEAVSEVVERWGAIDVLINNAGILRDAQLVKWKDGEVVSTMSEEAFDAVIGVNLRGVFLCTRAVVPEMIRAGGGVVLSASSVVGLYGNFGQTT